jgi:hypothetical protein
VLLASLNAWFSFTVVGEDGEVKSFMEIMGQAMKFHKTGRALRIPN